MLTHLKKRWKLISIFAGLATIAILVVSWGLGSSLSAAANHPVKPPETLAVEPVSFLSASGSTIHGWLVTPATNRGVIILQHGVRGCRSDMMKRAKFLSEAGYGILMFDFQAHGESAGQQITFGYLESRDSRAAVDYVRQRFPDRPIGLIGVSLGAAAALLAEPVLKIHAFVLESSFPDFVTATKDRLEWVTCRPARMLSPLLTLQTQLRFGVSADEIRPIDRVEKIKVPKLFLHGTLDPRTKFHEAEELFSRAADPKTFFPVVGAGHEDMHVFLGKDYEDLVLNFFEKNLNETNKL